MAAVNFDRGWDPASLRVPEIILPVQMGGGGNRSGELDLLRAVFEDGIRTYCKEIVRGSTTSLDYREVDDWIFHSDSRAITSFATLCDVFGIDAEGTRVALRRLRSHSREEVAVLAGIRWDPTAPETRSPASSGLALHDEETRRGESSRRSG
jgi:hypothetical protein